MLLTRSPLSHRSPEGSRCFVRLACLRHTASVHPEPGSNSPKQRRTCGSGGPFRTVFGVLSESTGSFRVPGCQGSPRRMARISRVPETLDPVKSRASPPARDGRHGTGSELRAGSVLSESTGSFRVPGCQGSRLAARRRSQAQGVTYWARRPPVKSGRTTALGRVAACGPMKPLRAVTVGAAMPDAASRLPIRPPSR